MRASIPDQKFLPEQQRISISGQPSMFAAHLTAGEHAFQAILTALPGSHALLSRDHLIDLRIQLFVHNAACGIGIVPLDHFFCAP